MRNQGNRQILGWPTIHLDKGESNTTSIYENWTKESSVKSLRSWGNDYPYLNNFNNCAQACLPIPENSDAQRLIRSLTRYPSVK